MKNWDIDGLVMGVCYYPEHWPKDVWEEDLDRMKEVGISVVRIAEFAWALMEPREGVFDFSLFSEFMDLCDKKGMDVIVGTPTATPPAWLTHKYPEVLNQDELGHVYHHGHRRHYNMNTKIYYDLSRRIVEKMAYAYKDKKCLIGWQLDNEFNCSINSYHSKADDIAFRTYLKDKFKDLDTLNEALGNTFWSQIYTDWNQIETPKHVAANAYNPHMMLEFRKFISDTVLRYAKMQTETLRSIIPADQFITTNGLFKYIDYKKMQDANTTDYITFDSYPGFSNTVNADLENFITLRDRDMIKNLSMTRGLSANFGVMEQQSGGGGWTVGSACPMPKPGQMRLWTYQSVAHGADFISYFRWRTSPMGTEIYWEGINSHDNRPDARRVLEAQEIGKEFKSLQEVAGSKYVAKVGYIHSYANDWDAYGDTIRRRYQDISDASWFRAATLSHTPMDYVYLDENTKVEDLKKYELLVFSHACIVTKKVSEILSQYVKEGGTLVIGARTGNKDDYGKCPIGTIVPGNLTSIAGAQSVEGTFLGALDEKMTATWKDKSIAMPLYNEILKTIDKDTKVLASFDRGHYQGMAAVTEKKSNKGSVIFVGGAFSEDMAYTILEYTKQISPFKDVISLPKEMELAVRGNDNTNYYFVLNYTREKQDLKLKKSFTDLLTKKDLSGDISIEPFDVLILKE